MSRQLVVICQRRLTHYRVPLFEHLRSTLANKEIELQLVVGQAASDETGKCDSGQLDWATQVTNRYWCAHGIRFCWQPLPGLPRKADLIVVTQENSLLSNYPLLMRSRAGPGRTALWGHGANFQAHGRHKLRERLRSRLTNRAHWWFAYTDASVEAVAAAGYPRNRITNLENATDTRSLIADLRSVTERDVSQLRVQFGAHAGNTGLFIGSLYKNKRLHMLFDVARQLHTLNPLFRLVIVGDGPLAGYVKENCLVNPWCIWVGARTGADKARHLAAADVMLHPGALGLGILDSFCSGMPLVTMDDGCHGPEIAYLRHGVNAHMTGNSVPEFVAGAQKVLTDAAYRGRLAAGCVESARRYTIENMTRNFCDGIARALAA